MASTDPSIYQTEDRCRIRLQKIIDSACTEAFYYLLCWLLPNWDRSNTNFQDYLKTQKNISKKKSKDALNSDQKKEIAKNPKGDTWDMSLLYNIIVWGSEFLADKEDPVWLEEVTCPSSLELLITTVKKERNSLAHPHEAIDSAEFFTRTEKIRKLLEEIMLLAGSLCNRDETEVKQIVIDFHITINKCRDDHLDPMDFDEYRQQPIFHHQRDLVRVQGKCILRKCHSKYRTLTPVSYLLEAKFPVHGVYTKMELMKDGANNENIIMEIECLLEGDNQMITNSIILVEGDVGFGKSTLTRKMLNDWIEGLPHIKFLKEFDIVLHVECRDHIASFNALAAYAMPELSKSFQGDDIIYVLGDLRTLVIVDGLDELNPKSTDLLKEILQLKTKYVNFTVLITTRPEAVEKYKQLVNHTLSETKHIRLLGIPSEKKDEFVKKYFDSLEKQGLKVQDINHLLKYLCMTEYCFGDLWRSPYNLALLVILWTLKPHVINNITTASELYWEMLLLYLEKLKDRLVHNPVTKNLSLASLNRKIDLFMHCLCQEAFTALASNNVTLDHEAYGRIKTRCDELEVPVEEMIEIFLKKTTTSAGIKYAFPHKGFQEFLSAYFVSQQIKNPEVSCDIQKTVVEIEKVLDQNTIPLGIHHDITQFVKDRLRRTVPGNLESTSNASNLEEQKVIRQILINAVDPTNLDLSKYESLLIHLIWLFFCEKDKIREDVKREALHLLQETGLKSRAKWLNVLNGTKCDGFVATFITAQTEILRGKIRIRDSSISAYISLLQALEYPIGEALITGITIDIRADSHNINELLNEVNGKELSVASLYFQHDFRHPTDVVISKYVANQLFARAKLENYTGAFTPGMKLPHLKQLRVSTATTEAFEEFHSYLESNKADDLRLCVPPTLDSSNLRPIPLSSLEIFLPDVISEGMDEAVAKVKALNPINGMITRVFYPRSNLSQEDIQALLDKMASANVKVTEAIYFPSKLKPAEPSGEELLQTEAIHKSGCPIEWGTYLTDEWEKS